MNRFVYDTGLQNFIDEILRKKEYEENFVKNLLAKLQRWEPKYIFVTTPIEKRSLQTQVKEAVFFGTENYGSKILVLNIGSELVLVSLTENQTSSSIVLETKLKEIIKEIG